MIQQNSASSGSPEIGVAAPVICSITWRDVLEALRLGLADFRAERRFGLIFGGFYTIGGLTIVACLFWLDMIYLAYPLAAGYALIGPFAAAGLYEVSRRREQHFSLAWRDIFRAVTQQSSRELGWMAFIGVFILIIWMYQVRLLLAFLLGLTLPPSLSGFLDVLFTTSEGLTFLVIGHVVGAALALVTFALTVVASPLLLDRDLDCITAMIASVQSVLRNPRPMLGWAALVAALLALGMAPLFLGLTVVLPILGHANWHLYRRLVAPAVA